jgi:predicted negative regulator of RcsB-dependent stress response
MAELQTDEEKVEAIKKWWKENGTSVIAGVVIGLGAVFGWRAWVDYRDNVGQRASLAYEQLLAATSAGAAESAEKQAEALIDSYGNTPYAMLAELALARVRVEQEDLAGAEAALRSALEKAPDPALAKVAAFRLARVLIAAGDLDGAATVIDQHDDGGAFSADFAGLRGDIAAAREDWPAARAAYRQAIDGGAALARIMELKLQDLPGGDAS